MAYLPNTHIVAACALLLACSPAIHAETEAQLNPVTVTGERGTGYVAKSAMIAGPGGTQEVELKDLPASVSVITRDLLDDKQVKVMSEAVRLDASIGDYYSPIGYYENLYIRGFPLDPATSFKYNGLTVTGQQNFAFENKERMEILKGVSALEVGAASPGGIVNFVTKRAKEVNSYTVGTGERGTRYVAADYGTFLNPEKTLGIRLNAAHEDIRPFVKGAEGYRDFASIAVDAKLSNKTKIEFDFEYQYKSQKSVPALMLQGGSYYDINNNYLGSIPTSFPTARPDIMLGYHSWVPPTQTESINSQLRTSHQLHDDLKTFFDIGYSRVKINDQSLYAYGCSTDSLGYFSNFCKDGSYDAYDFRSLGEIHSNSQLQLGISGKNLRFGTQHEWTIGLSEMHREVSKGTSIYEYVGSDNIYSPTGNISPSTQSAGPTFKILNQNQTSFFTSNKFSIGNTSTYLGIRAIQIDQHAYTVNTGAEYAQLKKWWLTPQVGINQSITSKTNIYISYSKGIEPGTIALADSFTNRVVMPPKLTNQIEIGAKTKLNEDSLWSIALFQLKRPNEFSIYAGNYLYTLYQDGTVTNRGIESSLSHKLSKRLNFIGSLMYLHATQSGVTVDPAQNGAQAIGIPNWRATAHLDYLIPNFEKLSVQGSWTYSSSKPVDLQDTLRAPGYHRFDAGAKYVEKVGKSQATFRLYVENVFNTFYWRDVSQSFGANFLYPGAPRIFRASATFDF